MIWIDWNNEIEFHNDELLAVDDASACSSADMAKSLEQPNFPFSAKEPNLLLEELTRLDALADQLELQRLEELQVLQDPSTVPSDSKGGGSATLRPVAVQQQPVLMSTQ